MGVPTSEVGYTIATTRRETTKVHKNMWRHWGGDYLLRARDPRPLSQPRHFSPLQILSFDPRAYFPIRLYSSFVRLWTLLVQQVSEYSSSRNQYCYSVGPLVRYHSHGSWSQVEHSALWRTTAFCGLYDVAQASDWTQNDEGHKGAGIYSGVHRNFVRGGFNKFSWGQRTERTGILGR